MGFNRRRLGLHPLKSTLEAASDGLASPTFLPVWHQSCSAPERASVALRCLGWLQASCANASMLELYQRRHPFGFQPSSQPCFLRHRRAFNNRITFRIARERAIQPPQCQVNSLLSPPAAGRNSRLPFANQPSQPAHTTDTLPFSPTMVAYTKSVSLTSSPVACVLEAMELRCIGMASLTACRVRLQGHHSCEHHVHRTPWQGLRCSIVAKEGSRK